MYDNNVYNNNKLRKVFEMETTFSGELKVQLSDYIKTNGLNQIMQDTLLDYLLSLHVSELSKEQYLCRLRKFGFNYKPFTSFELKT